MKKNTNNIYKINNFIIFTINIPFICKKSLRISFSRRLVPVHYRELLSNGDRNVSNEKKFDDFNLPLNSTCLVKSNLVPRAFPLKVGGAGKG